MLLKNQSYREVIDQKLEKSIRGIILCSIKLFVWHVLFTWMFFDFFGIKLKFVGSLTAGLLSIFPIVSPWVLSIPATFYLLLAEGLSISMLVFGILYIFLCNAAYTNITEKTIEIMHPYYIALSIAMGIYAFGISGIFYGPLIICVSKIIYEAVRNLNKSPYDLLKHDFFLINRLYDLKLKKNNNSVF